MHYQAVRLAFLISASSSIHSAAVCSPLDFMPVIHNSTPLLRVQSVRNCPCRLNALNGSSAARARVANSLSFLPSGQRAARLGAQATHPVSTNPQKDIRDLQCELDKEQGQTRKAIVKTGPSSGKAQRSGSFDAVAVAVIGLILSAVAVVSVGRMSEVDRRALAIGLTSGAAGLAVGYGVGRVRR